MKILKKLFSVVMCLSLIMSIFACSNNSLTATETTTVGSSDKNESVNTGSSEKVYKIGTLQLIQHAALDKAYDGFVAYLGEKGIKFDMDYQNASGEQSACQTIADKFANENLDLVYAIATPAAQSALALIDNVPIVASAVTDPAASGLCTTNENPGGNLTAASDLTPVAAQIDLLVELLPNAKNIGIMYCSAEANSKIQADMAIEACEKKGLNYAEFTVVNSADIQTVVESMVGKVDAIYVPTDNTLAAGMDVLSTIANDNKIPVIAGEEGMVDSGALATYGIDYFELGRIAGEIAEEILVNGKKPADIPVRYLNASACVRKINQETAEKLGLQVK